MIVRPTADELRALVSVRRMRSSILEELLRVDRNPDSPAVLTGDRGVAQQARRSPTNVLSDLPAGEKVGLGECTVALDLSREVSIVIPVLDAGSQTIEALSTPIDYRQERPERWAASRADTGPG